MKNNKWLYYGAAVFIGIIIANYIVREEIQEVELEKLEQEEIHLLLEQKEASLQKTIENYHQKLEGINEYYLKEISPKQLRKLYGSIEALNKMQSYLQRIDNFESPLIRMEVVEEQIRVDDYIKANNWYLGADYPIWRSTYREMVELKEELFALEGNFVRLLLMLNDLKLAYLNILKGNLAEKWNMQWVEGGVLRFQNKSYQIEDFYIGRYELTQKRWDFVMQTYPPLADEMDLMPVHFINEMDAATFCNKLSAHYNLEAAYEIDTSLNTILRVEGANGFRLPSFQEWLYAAKGGQQSRDYKYAGGNDLRELANYDNHIGSPQDVGQFKANELGLYDMNGNIAEWTSYDGKLNAPSGGHYASPSYQIKLDVPFLSFGNNRYPYYGMRLLLPAKTLRDDD
jgi:sulfatase modifying factor 1